MLHGTKSQKSFVHSNFVKTTISKQASCNIIKLFNHTCQKLKTGKRVSQKNIEEVLGCSFESALHAIVQPNNNRHKKVKDKVGLALRTFKDVIWEIARSKNLKTPEARCQKLKYKY